MLKSEKIQTTSDPLKITFYCLKTRSLGLLSLNIANDSFCSISLTDDKRNQLFLLPIDSRVADFVELVSLFFCFEPCEGLSDLKNGFGIAAKTDIALSSTLYSMIAYAELGKVGISDNDGKTVAILFFDRYVDSETSEIIDLLRSLQEFFVLFQIAQKAKIPVHRELEMHYHRFLDKLTELIELDLDLDKKKGIVSDLELREWRCYIQFINEIISAA